MKKEKIFGSIALFFAALFIMGLNTCQTTGANYYYDTEGKYVEITDPVGQCVLYQVVGTNTQVYKYGLFAFNYAAIKAGWYTGEQALEELATIEAETLRPGATVGSWVNTLMITAAKASKVGAPELVTITHGLDIHKANMTPLDQCTRYKLINEIGGHRAVAMAFAAQAKK